MKIRYFAILFLTMLGLVSCSMEKKRIDYHVVSARVPTLEIPPDLTVPANNEHYSIPGGDGALVASYSDYSLGTVVQIAMGAVLPEYKNVRLERKDNEYWLVVNDTAENVWPLMKAFWLEMGFQIRVDNPQAGVLETDWQENSGNVPQHYLRGVLGNGKLFDTLKPAGQRDQYLTRLERSKDGKSTELYLTRQVLEEIQVVANKETKWLPHISNVDIQIAVLKMLMVKIGNDKNLVTTPVALVPVSAVIAASSVAASVSVELKESGGSKLIQIGEPFDKSWRKVGLALDKARIAVEDKDRSKGLYLLKALPAVKGKKLSGYKVTVIEVGTLCEVAVRAAGGESDNESLRLIDELYQNIEK